MARVVSVETVRIDWIGIDVTYPVITAIGTVNTAGWLRFRLEPFVYIVPPADGMLDLDFVGEPPSGNAIQLMTSTPPTRKLIATSLEDFWGEGKPLTGVRLHASSNSLEAEFDAWPEEKKGTLTGLMRGDDTPYPLRKLAAMLGDEDPFPLSKVESPFDEDLKDLLVGKRLRTFYTGSALTMDYVPGRINIEVHPTTQRVVNVFEG